MIEYIKGDMLTADVQALVNTVNTVGVMGKGIALQFKEQFPNNYIAYFAACKTNKLQVGKMFVFEETLMNGGKKIIINFPTKKDWKHKSKLEYIDLGLEELTRVIKDYKIESIALPPLGCGNGGLDWDSVKVLIEKYLSSLNIKIFVYEPNAAVRDILIKQVNNKEIQLTDARAMLLYAMYYYESLGETVSLFVANKLAYFYQRMNASDFKRLRFDAGRYGPYSHGVDLMVHSLNGKYLRGTEQMTNKAFDSIELKYEHLKEVSEFVRKMKPDKQQRVKDLIKLITGFQSALALEVLASVDYIRKNNPSISKEATVNAIQNWSERKKDLFKTEYIYIAYDHLEEYANKINIG